jgi:biopolymer transport protein ExbD
MTKGGIIIRLIDVALIILFGFIAISDIKVRAQIKLPSDKQESESKTKQEIIFVEIGLEGSFIIKKEETILAQTADLEQLERNLIRLYEDYKSKGSEVVVLIKPHKDSIIQRTVDVLDICERHQIPKNINY